MANLDKNWIIGIAIVIIAVIVTSGLVYTSLNPPENTITLYTTTSTRDSGLLDYLKPLWEKDTGINVSVVAVGTGAALEAARNGLADLVMVHARSLEDEFISEGYGMHRVSLMHNDFVLVGPSSDPAGIMGMTNATQAFQKLYQDRNQITFASRGDLSGTNVKELALWNKSGVVIEPDNTAWAAANPWYLDLGSGMAATLRSASLNESYTLSDRATFLNLNDSLTLSILAQDPTGKIVDWANPYGVILVNPAKIPNVPFKTDLAKKWIEWLISKTGQDAINAYRLHNTQVFFADFQALKGELNSTELAYWGMSS